MRPGYMISGNEEFYHSTNAAVEDAKYILQEQPDLRYLHVVTRDGNHVCTVRMAFKVEYPRSKPSTRATDNAPLADIRPA